MSKRSWLFLLILIIGAVPLRADDRIFIEAKLNGQPLKVAFDTGATAFIILRTAAEQRGLKIFAPAPEQAAPPGKITMGLTETVKIELGGNGQIVTGKLSVLEDPSIRNFFDIEAVVGWPVLRNNLWLLNGSTLEIKLLEKLPAEAGHWIKLRELRRVETLCLELPGLNPDRPQYLGVDTGSDSDIALSPEAWKTWREAHRDEPVTLEGYYMPIVNFVVGEIAWAKEIDLGGVTFRGVTLRKMNQTEIDINPTGTVASLGLGALRGMDCVLDGANGVVYLHSLNTPAKTPVHNLLGAVFIPSGPESDDLIAHVAKDSPAEKAGVRNGDVLLKIDALDVTPWRTQPGILPLRRFFEQASGTKLRLTLRRDGRTIAVDVTLRDIIGPKSS